MTLIRLYEDAIRDRLHAEGLRRVSAGLYLQSVDDIIWRGLWVHFYRRKGTVGTNVALVIFCPKAFEITRKCLTHTPTGDDTKGFAKLGFPQFVKLLYQCVKEHGITRSSLSYNIDNQNEIGEKSDLIVSDYKVVRNLICDVSSYIELKDLIIDSSFGTGRAIYSISVSYLIDGERIQDELPYLSKLSNNKMTEEFVKCFKREYLGAL